MSVSGQSSARPAGLFFVEPIPALGIVPLRKTKDPPSAMCSWPPFGGAFLSENRGRLSRRCDSRSGTTPQRPPVRSYVRPSQTQAPAVLDHSRTLPQRDGRAERQKAPERHQKDAPAR